MAETTDSEERPYWWLDRHGRLCYDVIRHSTVVEHGLNPNVKFPVIIDPASGQDFLWREYKKLTDALIDGEYFGPLKGETNVALNMAHFYWSLAKVVEEELGFRKYHDEILPKVYALRRQRWPENLPW